MLKVFLNLYLFVLFFVGFPWFLKVIADAHLFTFYLRYFLWVLQ